MLPILWMIWIKMEDPTSLYPQAAGQHTDLQRKIVMEVCGIPMETILQIWAEVSYWICQRLTISQYIRVTMRMASFCRPVH